AGVGIALYANNDNSSNGVTYDGNGGSNDGTTSYTFTNTTVIANLFIYDDHIFTGWNTKANGSGTSYVEGNVVSSGTKLYAQWTENYFTDIDVSELSPSYSLDIYVGSTQEQLIVNGIPCVNIAYSSSDHLSVEINGASDWAVGYNCLTFDYGSHTYSLEITMSNATSQTYVITSEYLGMSFEASGQQELFVVLSLTS
ncbi:MAG: InlB B-repeat-containing protein, partial [Candidatus Methanomethylophilaceae archaeon]|nr:InlB B-repeat-containing protein [Candidatus Methanomethylophilaceae archaeon]